MRRALFQQPLIIAGLALAFAPAGRRVVARLLHQHGQIVVKLDHAFIVVTHTGRVMADSDIVWRRPSPGAQAPAPPAGYAGPPAGAPAEPGWQPPSEEQISAPRPLPPVDHDAIDTAEYQARWVTYAVGLCAAAVLLAMACARGF